MDLQERLSQFSCTLSKSFIVLLKGRYLQGWHKSPSKGDPTPGGLLKLRPELGFPYSPGVIIGLDVILYSDRTQPVVIMSCDTVLDRTVLFLPPLSRTVIISVCQELFKVMGEQEAHHCSLPHHHLLQYLDSYFLK